MYLEAFIGIQILAFSKENWIVDVDEMDLLWRKVMYLNI